MADMLLDGSEDRSLAVLPPPAAADGASLTLKAADATGPSAQVGGDLVLSVGAGAAGGNDGQVQAAGIFVENQTAFGSPIIGSQTPGGFMSYTADGQGPDWGGTGLTVQNAGISGSIARITVNDVDELAVIPNGMAPNNYGLPAAQAQTIAADGSISPTLGLITLGAGVLKTITPIPNLAAVFNAYWLDIIPTAAFTWDTTGNIAIPGSAEVGKVLRMIFNAGTWYPSYTC